MDFICYFITSIQARRTTSNSVHIIITYKIAVQGILTTTTTTTTTTSSLWTITMAFRGILAFTRKRRQPLFVMILMGVVIFQLRSMTNRTWIKYDDKRLANGVINSMVGKNSREPVRGVNGNAGPLKSPLLKTTKFIVSPDISTDDDDIILVIVPSRPSDYEKRNLIRLSWGNAKYDKTPNGKLSIVTIFSIGLSYDGQRTRNETSPQDMAVMAEADSLADILLLNMSDSYRNLVGKVRLSMEWISLYSRAKYILKVDDDIMLNVFRWAEIIEALHIKGASCFILGCAWLNGKPDRDVQNKFPVSRDEYAGDSFPSYIIGGAYLMSRDAMVTTMEVSSQLPIFKFEDVYFNGLSAKQTRIHLLAFPKSSLVLLPIKLTQNDIGKFVDNNSQALVVHLVPKNHWWKIWNKFKLAIDRSIGAWKIKLRDVTDTNTTIPQRWVLNNNTINMCSYQQIDLNDIIY